MKMLNGEIRIVKARPAVASIHTQVPVICIAKLFINLIFFFLMISQQRKKLVHPLKLIYLIYITMVSFFVMLEFRLLVFIWCSYVSYLLMHHPSKVHIKSDTFIMVLNEIKEFQ